jgi:hypothetical protein
MYAYPYQHRHPTTGVTTMSEGMTLRDYFAAKAMQSYIQQNSLMLAIADEKFSIGKICNASYEWADAMLKAREVKHD